MSMHFLAHKHSGKPLHISDMLQITFLCASSIFQLAMQSLCPYASIHSFHRFILSYRYLYNLLFVQSIVIIFHEVPFQLKHVKHKMGPENVEMLFLQRLLLQSLWKDKQGQFQTNNKESQGKAYGKIIIMLQNNNNTSLVQFVSLYFSRCFRPYFGLRSKEMTLSNSFHERWKD